MDNHHTIYTSLVTFSIRQEQLTVCSIPTEKEENCRIRSGLSQQEVSKDRHRARARRN